MARNTRSLMGPRFTNRQGAVWTRIGHVFSNDDGIATAYDAMDAAGALCEFEKRPLMSFHPETGEPIDSGKSQVWRKPTMRDPNWKMMQAVDRKFEIVQPADIARILDTPRGGNPAISQRWPVDTVGVTPNNGGMFITLKSAPYEVAGDQVNRYFLITNGNDGGTSLRVGIVHLRLACWNTLTAALRGAFVSVEIPHRKHANENLAIYANLIARMEEAEHAVSQAFQRLALTPASDAVAHDIFDRLFADPPKPQTVRALEKYQTSGAFVELDMSEAERLERAQYNYENKLAREAERREMARTLHGQYNADNPRSAGTAWSIFQAVTELLDNMAGAGESDAAQDKTAAEIMFGRRAATRDQAFQMVYELAK